MRLRVSRFISREGGGRWDPDSRSRLEIERKSRGSESKEGRDARRESSKRREVIFGGYSQGGEYERK